LSMRKKRGEGIRRVERGGNGDAEKGAGTNTSVPAHAVH